jgi:hypothetical protein
MYARMCSCLVAFVFLTAAAGAAQTETGRVTGSVDDASGLVVPGATATLTSTTTGAFERPLRILMAGTSSPTLRRVRTR